MGPTQPATHPLMARTTHKFVIFTSKTVAGYGTGSGFHLFTYQLPVPAGSAPSFETTPACLRLLLSERMCQSRCYLCTLPLEYAHFAERCIYMKTELYPLTSLDGCFASCLGQVESLDRLCDRRPSLSFRFPLSFKSISFHLFFPSSNLVDSNSVPIPIHILFCFQAGQDR